MFFKKNTAKAKICGSPEYPNIKGTVKFIKDHDNVRVEAKIKGLPTTSDGCSKCNNRIFAMHIHQGCSCTGNECDPFADTKAHYNPNDCEHPYHAGDLPPLFSNDGCAEYTVILNRFTIDEIIGRTVVIHENPDDFTTQPSGDSGDKIACGVIKKC